MRNSKDLEKLLSMLSKAERKAVSIELDHRTKKKKYVSLHRNIGRKRPRNKEYTYDDRRYLFKQVLKTLCVLQTELSPEAAMLEKMNAVELLNRKELHDARKQMTAQLKKEAYQYERWELLPEILRLERIRMNYESGSLANMKELDAVLARIRNISGYRHLSAMFSELYSKYGEIRTGEQKKAYDRLMSDRLLKNARATGSDEERFYFYSLHTVAHLMHDRTGKANAYNSALLQMIEARAILLRHPIWQKRYLVSLDNQFLICTRTNRINDAEAILEKLKKQKGYADNFTLRYVNLLGAYANAGEFGKGLKYADELAEKVDGRAELLPERSRPEMITNLSYIYFGAGEFSRSLYWLNQLINDRSIQTREDIRSFSRLYLLVIHYELGNQDLLEYLVRSTYRFLSQQKRIFRFEEAFLQFVRKMPDSAGDKVRMNASFVELKKMLGEIFVDANEARVLEYFNFPAWLESKISGKKFDGLVRSKFLEGQKKSL